MKKITNQEIFETEFADNFQPNWLEKLVQRWETNRESVILSLLPDHGGILVDVPCGDGDLLLKASTRFKKLIGYDISRVRITNAKKLLAKTAGRVELSVQDVDQGLPLKANSVDALVCNAAIGCFVNPEAFLAEAHRVLKPKGTLIIQIGNYAYLTRRLALLMGSLPKISSFRGFGDGGMLHYFTYAVLAELITAQGFQITNQTNSGVAASLRRWWPSLLAPDIIYQAVKK